MTRRARGMPGGPTGVQGEGEALARPLDPGDDLDRGAPEDFQCACGERVLKGDPFYEDEDGLHCMDCGMDIQDRGVRGD